MKSPSILLSLLALAILTLTYSCKDDTEPGVDIVDPPAMSVDLYSGINISVALNGQVTDETGAPVIDADVRVGNVTTTTDERGQFRFEAVSLDDKRAYVQVEADGYFSSGAIVDAQAGVINRTDVQLMARTFSATLDEASGGVATGDGISIDFPANSISYEDGSEYTGGYRVFMRALTQESIIANRLMPGDMAAMDESMEVGALTSYSMIAVDIETASGEPLQITEGMEAQVTFPIPTDAQAGAPETIALWSWDETEGVWMEEGEATRQGNQYVGAVSHFSWWNCDVFFESAYLTVCVTQNEGTLPASYAYASITTEGALTGNGYTGLDGCFATFVPAGESMTLTIYDICQNVLSTSEIGPFSDGSEPSVTTNVQLPTTTVTGTIIGCDGAPVVGEIYLSSDSNATYFGIYASAEVNADGSFVLSNFSCPLTITGITVLSESNIYYTIPFSQSITLGEVNDIGEFSICDAPYEYFIIDIDGSVSSDPYIGLVGFSDPYWYFQSENNFTFVNTGTTGEADFYNAPNSWAILFDWVTGEQYDISQGESVMNVTQYPSQVGGYLEGSITGTANSLWDSLAVAVPYTIDFRLQVEQ